MFAFVNSEKFPRNNQLFYKSLTSKLYWPTTPFFTMAFTARHRSNQKNSCLEYESPALTSQTPVFITVDLGIPVCRTDASFSSFYICWNVKLLYEPQLNFSKFNLQ